MNRRQFIRMLGISGASFLMSGLNLKCQKSESKREELPNFVILFADDLGYGDPSCYGHPTIRTPRIDQMADEGVRFTSFYVPGCVCSPSRAALLTGRHPLRCGMPRVLLPDNKYGLPTTEITLADMLKKKNYRTACIGKWHIGHSEEKYMPTSRGFDYYYGLLYSNDMKPPWVKTEKPLELYQNLKPIEHPVVQETLTERYTEEAIKFIKSSKNKPFFLYLPYTMPHLPVRASEKFRGQSRCGLYGDVIETIDWSVGRVLDTLKQLNLEEKTFVIFTSDNGPWLNLPDRMLAEGIEHWHAGSRGPLNGGKATTYDGGVRVPGVFRWPNRIPENKVIAEPSSTLDIFPTILKLADIPLPKDRIYDGSNIMPLLEGKTTETQQEIYFSRGDFVEAVRDGEWKLRISNQDPNKKKKKVEIELYNLEVDPYEFYNVAERHSDIVDQLKNKMRDFANDVDGNVYF